ncbi:MAG: glycosyltransferase [Anaerolineae bacterium]|nr:glycosyltransferase [Anaerolineae bacterium]
MAASPAPPDDPSPFVTVIVPVYNEAAHLADCLASLLAQDYPPPRMEILVADGGSTDGSQAIVEGFARRDPRVRLLMNPRRIAAAGLNLGLRAARGDVIARADGHAVLAPDYLRRCVDALRPADVAGVGGPLRGVGQGPVGRAVALALASPFGAGDSAYHLAQSGRPREADTVYLGAYTRAWLERVGGYNEKLAANEDYELNFRLRRAGGRILLVPEISSQTRVRETLGALARQYAGYGFWKAQMLRRHPASLRVRQAVPPLWVAVLALGALGSFWSRTLLLAWVALMVVYLGATLAAVVAVFSSSTLHPRPVRRVRPQDLPLPPGGRGGLLAPSPRGGEGWGSLAYAGTPSPCGILAVRGEGKTSLRHLLLLPLVFWTMHLAWGGGFWMGILRRPAFALMFALALTLPPSRMASIPQGDGRPFALAVTSRPGHGTGYSTLGGRSPTQGVPAPTGLSPSLSRTQEREGVKGADAGDWTYVTADQGLPSSSALSLVAGPAGGFWVGTAAGLAYRSPGGDWQAYTTADGLAGDSVTALAMDGAGRLWIATTNGVSVLDDGSTPLHKGDDAWARFRAADGLPAGPVTDVAIGGSDLVWFATRDGGATAMTGAATPFNKVDDIWTTFTTAEGLPANQVNNLLLDGVGRVWMAIGTETGTGGLLALNVNGTPHNKADDQRVVFTSFDSFSGLPVNVVLTVARDANGRIWTGTAAGAAVLDYGTSPFAKGDDRWQNFGVGDGLPDDQITSIAFGGDGTRWFGTRRGGAAVLSDGGTPFGKSDDRWTSFTTADGLAALEVRQVLATGPQGLRWFATAAGLSSLDDRGSPHDKAGDLWRTVTADDCLASNALLSVLPGDSVWFGTEFAGASLLVREATSQGFRELGWLHFTAREGLASDTVFGMAADPTGTWWLGTDGGATAVSLNGAPLCKACYTLTRFTTADGLAANTVRGVQVDAQGNVWFAAGGFFGGGLSVLDDGGTPHNKTDDTWQTFGLSDGLASGNVRGLVLHGGLVWVATSAGVSLLDPHGTPFHKSDDRWITFRAGDGLAGDAVRAIAIDGAGRAWFATDFNGASVLDTNGTPFDKSDDRWQSYRLADGLASDFLYAVTIDAGGRVWFGTDGAGLSILDTNDTPLDKTDDRWETWTDAEGLPGRNLRALVWASEGLWVATYGSGAGLFIPAARRQYVPLLLVLQRAQGV